MFTSLAQTSYISKRFALKRFLGLSEEEIAENDELWAEENGTTSAQQTVGEDLRSVGVTAGNLNTDMADAEPPADDVDVGGDDVRGDVDAPDIEL